MILGDFSINANDTNRFLSIILSEYSMLVTHPTHINGSLIDHVYIKKDFCERFNINVSVKPLYFSDNDHVIMKSLEKVENINFNIDTKRIAIIIMLIRIIMVII